MDTNVVAMVNRVIDDYRGAAAAKGLRITSVLPADAPRIALDARRFAQVVEHLVDNALKFSAAGEVRVTLVTDADSGRPVRLVVSDTGIGIPADRLDRILEPFEQVDASSGRSYGGAGLGLPLARQICEVMGCLLTVESESRDRLLLYHPAPARNGAHWIIRRHQPILMRAGGPDPDEAVWIGEDLSPARVLMAEQGMVAAGVGLAMHSVRSTAAAQIYAISTNESNKKNIASIDETMPAGVSAASSLPITYRLNATPSAQMAAPGARTVTFAIVSGT